MILFVIVKLVYDPIFINSLISLSSTYFLHNILNEQVLIEDIYKIFILELKFYHYSYNNI